MSDKLESNHSSESRWRAWTPRKIKARLKKRLVEDIRDPAWMLASVASFRGGDVHLDEALEGHQDSPGAGAAGGRLALAVVDLAGVAAMVGSVAGLVGGLVFVGPTTAGGGHHQSTATTRPG